MALRPPPDTSPADWFVDSDADWRAKVALGPPGFEAYVRVPYDLDEEAPIDSGERLHIGLREILGRHTTTPDDCFFALWNGWGGFEGGRQDIGLRYALPLNASPAERSDAKAFTAQAKLRDYAPAFAQSFLDGPMVRTSRSTDEHPRDSRPRMTLRPLADTSPDLLSALCDVLARHAGTPEDCLFALWEDYGEIHGGEATKFLTAPHMPAWFVTTTNIDGCWTGVGGSNDLIADLIADRRTTYTDNLPEYL